MSSSCKFFILILVLLFPFGKVLHSQSLQWQQTNGPYGGAPSSFAIAPDGTMYCYIGGKLYKSTDGGNNWNYSNLTGKTAWYGYVKCNSKSEIFVGETEFIHKSTDGGIDWSTKQVGSSYIKNLIVDSRDYLFAIDQNHFYYSTDDGQTWGTNSGNIPVSEINDMSIASDSNYILTTSNGVFRSSDGGQNWFDITSNLIPGSYHGIAASINGKLFVGTLNKIYSSNDYGQSWDLSYSTFSNDYITYISIDSSNNIWAIDQDNLIKSTNQGASWSVVNSFSSQTAPPSNSFMQITKNGNIYAGCLLGILLLKNNASNLEIYNNGLVGTFVLGITASNKGIIFTHTPTDIYSSSDSGKIWRETNANINTNSIYSAIPPNNITTDEYGNVYFGDYGSIGFSSDNGNSWVKKIIVGDNNDEALSIFPEGNGKIYVATTSATFLSTNNGTTWTTLKEWGSNYDSTQLSVSNNGFIFQTRNDGIYKSTDNGDTWINSLKVNSQSFSNILITRKGYIIVGFSNGVYISKDNGKTWSIKQINQYAGATNILLETPDGNIYAKTFYGLYKSLDDGSTWNKIDIINSPGLNFSFLTTDKNGYLYSGCYYFGAGVFKTVYPIIKVLPVSPSALPKDSGAYVTWNKSATTNVVKYRVYGSINHYPTTEIDSTIGLNDTTKLITGLKNNVPYYFVVSAVDDQGNESFSKEITVTPTPLPSTPSFFGLINNSVNVPVNILFKWNKSPYAVSYHFQLSTDSLFTSLLVDYSLLTDTLRQVNNLQNLTKYFCRIKAKGVSGSSRWSDTISFTTVIALPGKPVCLNPPENSINQSLKQTFIWLSSQRAAKYNFELSKTQDFSVLISDTTLSDTSININLQNFTQYYWRVSAQNAGGSSAWSDVFNFTTIIAPPEIPILNYPYNNSVNIPASFNLRWDESARADKYRVQLATDSIFNSKVIVIDSLLTDTLCNTGNLLNETKYFWRVEAINIGGESGWTPVYTFKTTVALPSEPYLASPANNSIHQPINLIFSWFRIKNAQYYNLQLSESNDFKTLVMNDSLISDTSKQVTKLNNNAQYFWRVRAKNVGGYSPWSDIWNTKTIVSLPVVPILLTPDNGTYGTSVDLKLQWNPVKDADTYNVEVSLDSVFSNILVNDSNLVNTYADITGLQTGMRYFWKVNAKDYAGEGNYSNPWDFITILYPPGNLKAVNLSVRKVKLSWILKNENEDGIIIERNLNGHAGYELLDSLKSNDTTYIDTTVSGGLSYTYRLKCFTKFAASEYSNEAPVNTITNINESGKVPDKFALLQNYPNPFNQTTVINYEIPREAHVILKIYNLLGQEIALLIDMNESAGYHSYNFNAGNLSSGVYIYKLEAGGLNFLKKMIYLK